MANNDEKFLDYLADEERHRENDEDMTEFYRKWAAEYDSFSGSRGSDFANIKSVEYMREKLLELAKPIDELEIFDIACGTGNAGVYLQKGGFQHVDGVDLSEPMLDIARKTKCYRELFQGKITDTEKIKSEDGRYDGVICTRSICPGHLMLKNALPEFLRVVKQGGIIAFSVFDPENEMKAFDVLASFYNENKIKIMLVESVFFIKDVSARYEKDAFLFILKKL